jgi:hypothetical protein
MGKSASQKTNTSRVSATNRNTSAAVRAPTGARRNQQASAATEQDASDTMNLEQLRVALAQAIGMSLALQVSPLFDASHY